MTYMLNRGIAVVNSPEINKRDVNPELFNEFDLLTDSAKETYSISNLLEGSKHTFKVESKYNHIDDILKDSGA